MFAGSGAMVTRMIAAVSTATPATRAAVALRPIVVPTRRSTDTDLPAGVGEDRNGRDPQRTPVPWAPPSVAGPGAGLNVGNPWLPIGSTAEHLNVASELRDKNSMLSLYGELLRLRRARPFLHAGDQTFVPAHNDVLAYVRTAGTQRSLVLMNFSTAPTSLARESGG
jgi:alpha-glucosidase